VVDLAVGVRAAVARGGRLLHAAPWIGARFRPYCVRDLGRVSINPAGGQAVGVGKSQRQSERVGGRGRFVLGTTAAPHRWNQDGLKGPIRP